MNNKRKLKRKRNKRIKKMKKKRNRQRRKEVKRSRGLAGCLLPCRDHAWLGLRLLQVGVQEDGEIVGDAARRQGAVMRAGDAREVVDAKRTRRWGSSGLLVVWRRDGDGLVVVQVATIAVWLASRRLLGRLCWRRGCLRRTEERKRWSVVGDAGDGGTVYIGSSMKV